MELIVFVGVQGSGKSTFYARRFIDTHIRLNLDMLKTRNRESILFEACLAAKQPTVIDNTNPTPADRARYILPAKAQRFRAVGYYFQSTVEECKRRNALRSEGRAIPLPGLLGTHTRLVPPRREEGFDELHVVRIAEDGQFLVEPWSARNGSTFRPRSR
ncbi:MAG TPA: AAA family ATPase [Tepidisphaeraceae bacterium]|jgi:predicted kinase